MGAEKIEIWDECLLLDMTVKEPEYVVQVWSTLPSGLVTVHLQIYFMSKVCMPPGDAFGLWIRTTPAPLLPGSQELNSLRMLEHSALLILLGVYHIPHLCRRQEQVLGQGLSGVLAWVSFLSSVSAIQKSLSQLVGTIQQDCHHTNGQAQTQLYSTILIVNVVKHLVFSICHNFCCLLLYFVQIAETGMVGLPVTGFHLSGICTHFVLCVLIQIDMIGIGWIWDYFSFENIFSRNLGGLPCFRDSECEVYNSFLASGIVSWNNETFLETWKWVFIWLRIVTALSSISESSHCSFWCGCASDDGGCDPEAPGAAWKLWWEL